jgi:hypothetical protein
MAKVEGPDRWEKLEDTGIETLEDLKARIRTLEALVPKTEAPAQDDDLENKSMKQLKELAVRMEPPVDLSTCNGKAEYINAIRSAIDAA